MQGLPKDHVKDMNVLNQLSGSLSSAGILIRAQTGVYFMSLLIVVPMMILAYLSTSWFVLLREHIRANSLAMILFPYQSNRHLRSQINNIIARLRRQIVQQSDTCNCLKILHGAKKNRSSFATCLYHSKAQEPVGSFRPSETQLDFKQNCSHTIKLLNTVQENNLVRPCISSVNWLKNYLRLVYSYLFTYVIVLNQVVAILTAPYILEAFNYSAQRLSEMRCEHQFPGQNYVSTLYRIAGIEKLEPGDVSKYEPFLTRDPSWFERIQLAAFVESKYTHFKWKSLVQWSKTIVICLFICISLSWWFFMNVIEFYGNTSLLIQVRSQLKSILQELQRIRQHKHRVARDEYQDEKLDDRFQTEFERKLLISYLTFQLARERYPCHHEFKQLVIIQGSGLSSWCFAAMYLVASTMDTKHMWLTMLLSGNIIAYNNINLFTATYGPRIMQDIMKILITILIDSSELMPATRLRSLVYDLWQRQLLTEGEVVKQATASIFSINITQTKLIVINVNLIGLWLMMVRFQLG